MAAQPRTFSPTRAVESLLYLVSKLGQPTTLHEVLKLRYFADKIHLSLYGDLSSGDEYVAMDFGPVASNVYNMLKAARGEKNRWIDPSMAEAISGALKVDPSTAAVTALRDPNLSRIAPSEMECIDRAIEQFGGLSFEERTNLSHDDAWKAGNADATRRQAEAGRMSLKDIINTLPNADEVLEYVSH